MSTQYTEPANYTVPKLAEHLDVSISKAWQLVHRRQIGFYRVGRKVQISAQHIAEFLARNEVKPVDVTATASAIVRNAASRKKGN